MAPLARRGINPALGSGKQYIPWMDIGDLVRLYGFMLEHTDLSGIFNAVSTQHLTMNDMANRVLQQFGKRKRTPNVPVFVIRLLFGEMSVIMLCGSRVSNEKIRDAGFRFIPEVQV
jgi:NAD dependent epimerase/dehydratase family enzyme